jgi:hypothetical protein
LSFHGVCTELNSSAEKPLRAGMHNADPAIIFFGAKTV